jgi:hypothetical protein
MLSIIKSFGAGNKLLKLFRDQGIFNQDRDQGIFDGDLYEAHGPPAPGN